MNRTPTPPPLTTTSSTTTTSISNLPFSSILSSIDQPESINIKPAVCSPNRPSPLKNTETETGANKHSLNRSPESKRKLSDKELYCDNCLAR